MLFSKSLHLRLRWQCLSRLQFKARGPDFHAELFPVHSPLLRESYLVSYPPLTYMLKFSGFADLTSCLGWREMLAIGRMRMGVKHTRRSATHRQQTTLSQVARRGMPQFIECVRRSALAKSARAQTRKRSRTRRCARRGQLDTEAGILSGISRERSIRSKSYWFTEFCNSQCLSHFAAPFIVVRAETSVAESCN